MWLFALLSNDLLCSPLTWIRNGKKLSRWERYWNIFSSDYIYGLACKCNVNQNSCCMLYILYGTTEQYNSMTSKRALNGQEEKQLHWEPVMSLGREGRSLFSTYVQCCAELVTVITKGRSYYRYTHTVTVTHSTCKCSLCLGNSWVWIPQRSSRREIEHHLAGCCPGKKDSANGVWEDFKKETFILSLPFLHLLPLFPQCWHFVRGL